MEDFAVNRVWSNCGEHVGLVDQHEIPLPEKPDTKDDEHLTKWKWEKSYQCGNGKLKRWRIERDSQWCEVELKLMVTPYKNLRRVMFTNMIPRSATRKIMRKQLKDQIYSRR